MSDFTSKLKNEGVDLEFFQQLKELERLEKEVEAGRFSREKFERLQAKVFSKNRKANNLRKEPNKAVPKKGKGGRQRGTSFVETLKSPRNFIRNFTGMFRNPSREDVFSDASSFSDSSGGLEEEFGVSKRTTRKPNTAAPALPPKTPKNLGSPRPRLERLSFRSPQSPMASSFVNRQEEPKRVSVDSEGGDSVSSSTTDARIRDNLQMLVKGPKGSIWSTRFVELYEDQLLCFESKDSNEPLKTVTLNGDYFVSEAKGALLEKMNNMKSNINASVRMRVNSEKFVFLVSNLSESYYFATPSEGTRQFWIAMLVQILRDIREKDEDLPVSPTERQLKQITNKRKNLRVSRAPNPRMSVQYQTMRRAMPNQALLASMNKGPGGPPRNPFDAKMIRQSVVLNWQQQQKLEVQMAIEAQKELEQKLKAKEEEAQQMQEKMANLDSEWKKRMQNFRMQAQSRNHNRQQSTRMLQKQIMTLRRMSVNPMAAKPGRDYEAEISALKKKLETLQSVLQVDVGDLDWDGTLEQAESKMKELLPDLMSEDPKVQQQAQTEFDKWDNIIRNHVDFKKREENKWVEWEAENGPKNEEALRKMRSFVPEKFRTGCSLDDIMKLQGVNRKIATRVKQNEIFKFFWMSKAEIAKIHIADLQNKYASQGLDLRELRAVYHTLPDKFMNDNDGRKKQFRDQMKARLFELSKKEAEGKLSPTDAINNAYRDKPVSGGSMARHPKPTGVKRAPVKKKPLKGKMAAKTHALEALLQNKAASGGGPKPPVGGGLPKPPNGLTLGNRGGRPSKLATTPSRDLDPEDPKWAKYFKMQKLNLPDPAIRAKIAQEHGDGAIWDELKSLKENQGASSSTPAASGAPAPPPKVMTSAAAHKSKELSSVLSSNTYKSRSGKSKKKKSVRKRRKNKRTLPPSGGGMNNILDKAHVDHEYGGKRKTGGAGVAQISGLEYSSKGLSKSQVRAQTMASNIDKSLEQLVDVIRSEGQFDSFEEGITITFVELFERYESISDMLVGLLLKAKRAGLIRYRGDMLFQGIHDAIKITLIE